MPLPAWTTALPSLCAVCRAWGRGRVCTDCRARFAHAQPRCRRCALVVPAGVSVCGECALRPPPLDRTVAAVDYAFPWDGLITQLKFNASLDLIGTLAELLGAAVERESAASSVDLVVPIPLSERRLRERGFNQAWELARRAAGKLRIEPQARALMRVKDTPHQLALARDRRADNVRGVFAVEPSCVPALRGRRIALVDDVMTTGATMHELAAVLQRAGAAQVHAWVVARTPRPGDD